MTLNALITNRTPYSSQQTPNEPKKGKEGLWIIIMIVLTVLVALSVGLN